MHMEQYSSKISDARGFTMGVAIIVIMLFHLSFCSSLNLDVFRHVGNWGVDMFLFVSGFGICHSLCSYTPSFSKEFILLFYFRRIVRILPAVMCFAVFRLVRGDIDSFSQAVKYALGLNYWYIVYIYVLYLLSPLFVWLILRCRYPLKRCCYVVAAATLIIIGITVNVLGDTVIPTLGKYALTSAKYMPVFLLGMCCYCSSKFGKIKLLDYIVAGVGLLIALWLEYNFNKRDLIVHHFSHCVIVGCVAFACCATFYVKKILPKQVSKAIVFAGSISLELYICHELIFGQVHKYYQGYEGLLISFSLSFLVAYLLSIFSRAVAKCVK